MKQYTENDLGVHLMTKHIGGGEYSVCGWAHDSGTEDGVEDLTPTHKRVVTCKGCIAEIENCRNVKYKRVKQND